NVQAKDPPDPDGRVLHRVPAGHGSQESRDVTPEISSTTIWFNTDEATPETDNDTLTVTPNAGRLKTVIGRKSEALVGEEHMAKDVTLPAVSWVAIHHKSQHGGRMCSSVKFTKEVFQASCKFDLGTSGPNRSRCFGKPYRLETTCLTGPISMLEGHSKEVRSRKLEFSSTEKVEITSHYTKPRGVQANMGGNCTKQTVVFLKLVADAKPAAIAGTEGGCSPKPSFVIITGTPEQPSNLRELRIEHRMEVLLLSLGIAAWGQMASRPHLGELLVQAEAGQLWSHHRAFHNYGHLDHSITEFDRTHLESYSIIYHCVLEWLITTVRQKGHVPELAQNSSKAHAHCDICMGSFGVEIPKHAMDKAKFLTCSS
ncbi:unnamed protein product, partial [Cladocopium goreaui]